MARPSSQKAAILAQIVRTGSLNRTPMEDLRSLSKIKFQFLCYNIRSKWAPRPER